MYLTFAAHNVELWLFFNILVLDTLAISDGGDRFTFLDTPLYLPKVAKSLFFGFYAAVP